jgi:integrase
VDAGNSAGNKRALIRIVAKGPNMPVLGRIKTKYPGVTFIVGKAVFDDRDERIYYIRYRKDGKEYEEKAGRQFQDDMTPAKAANIRALRIQGKEPSNQERRELELAAKNAEKNKWTIERLWDEYIKLNPNLKGIATDKNRFDKYLKPSIGKKEPRELIPLDVARLKIKFLKKKAPATVRNILELLKRIINFGANKRYCQGISFKIEMPNVNNLKTEDLSPEQLESLIKAIVSDTHPQAGNIMKMALYTGMRRGELFKLQWDHIDFIKGIILIKDPKGGQDQKVPLNDAVRNLLESMPRGKSQYVFPGRGSRQRTDINKAVNKIKTDAGLPQDFRPLHGLRHVYASMLASSGEVDMYTLQKLLTHKSPQMTQRYAHLRDDALKRAADLAGKLISEATKKVDEDKEKKVSD